jgi:transcriptional accessory protein Tex/SPT6
MQNTLKELEDLFWEYKNSNDQNAYIAVKECIEIIKKNQEEM